MRLRYEARAAHQLLQQDEVPAGGTEAWAPSVEDDAAALVDDDQEQEVGTLTVPVMILVRLSKRAPGLHQDLALGVIVRYRILWQ